MALRARGIRVRRGPLALTFLAEEGANGTRVAYAITKRVGGRTQFVSVPARASWRNWPVTRRSPGKLLVAAGLEATTEAPRNRGTT